jgi:hypothetical protein
VTDKLSERRFSVGRTLFSAAFAVDLGVGVGLDLYADFVRDLLSNVCHSADFVRDLLSNVCHSDRREEPAFLSAIEFSPSWQT